MKDETIRFLEASHIEEQEFQGKTDFIQNKKDQEKYFPIELFFKNEENNNRKKK